MLNLLKMNKANLKKREVKSNWLPHVKTQKHRIYIHVDLGIVKSGIDCKKLLRAALFENIFWSCKQS